MSDFLKIAEAGIRIVVVYCLAIGVFIGIVMTSILLTSRLSAYVFILGSVALEVYLLQRYTKYWWRHYIKK